MELWATLHVFTFKTQMLNCNRKNKGLLGCLQIHRETAEIFGPTPKDGLCWTTVVIKQLGEEIHTLAREA